MPKKPEPKKPLSGLKAIFDNNFIDYASYVVLDRAVPAIEDGLKPVQRRILHSLHAMGSDGRYNKAASVVGYAMRFHMHGDASIAEAMVNLQQIGHLIDGQGNWGNIYTGDRAAQTRYIEARLTKFANKILFDPKLTSWVPSYDGRAKEPTIYPVKFPLLLTQGASGIAVGLSTKILSHNFCESVEACIASLEKRPFLLLPDFKTGGLCDASEYNDGKAGGKIRTRARINIESPTSLVITEIPAESTTTNLIESIISASEKGKIKIKKIEDNTAKNVEVKISLPSGVDPEKTVEALYAFTKCEQSIYPQTCVIKDGKPVYLSVTELVSHSANRTEQLLKQGLENSKNELDEKMFFLSLEKIFIENKIYSLLESATDWSEASKLVKEALIPLTKNMIREISDEDIEALCELKIKRISRFDNTKTDQRLSSLAKELKEICSNIKNIKKYTIAHYQSLLSNFGKDLGRRTELLEFSSVNKVAVAAKSQKVFIDKKSGFVGTAIRKNAEELGECSELDHVIVFRKNGTYKKIKIADKTFVGTDVVFSAIWKAGDKNTVYTAVYGDGPEGRVMIKRFCLEALINNKEYTITKGNPGSVLHYLGVHSQGTSPEELNVVIAPKKGIKKKKLMFNPGELAIKGKGAGGNILSRHPVASVEPKQAKLKSK